MQKKTCPNGHVYDPDIYGEQCPLCPPTPVNMPPNSSPATQFGGQPGFDNKTHIGTPAQGSPMVTPTNPVVGGAPGMAPNDPTGATRVRPQEGMAQAGGHTVIRHANRNGAPAHKMPSRKLVGFLVTYNRDPNGKAYNIYEGRNFVGRSEGCDICVPDDDQMSGRHLSILYRNVDNKFKFRDEQSSNGTFVNRELLDDGELTNYDIIRAGSTIFIFIAIPNLS